MPSHPERVRRNQPEIADRSAAVEAIIADALRRTGHMPGCENPMYVRVGVGGRLRLREPHEPMLACDCAERVHTGRIAPAIVGVLIRASRCVFCDNAPATMCLGDEDAHLYPCCATCGGKPYPLFEVPHE